MDIRAKGYHMRIIWEHEFRSQEKSDLSLKQFIRQWQPPFYRKHCWMAKESTILNAMLTDNFFDCWKWTFMYQIIFTPTSKKCHPFSATLKSSSKTWAPSCKNMSEIMGCLISHVVSSSVAQDNAVFAYQQSKKGLSYFYCKWEVMGNGIHTKPLSITLSPWPRRQVELIDETHPWSLEKV